MESSTLRARAREKLVGNWGVSIGIAALAALLGGLLAGSSFLPTINAEFPIHWSWLEQLAETIEEGIEIGDITFHLRGGVFGLAAFLLGGTLQLGYAQFLLKQQDGQDAEFNDLFSQFHRYGTGFAQWFLRSLYVSLWGILFIIPGIVKSYSYAMTPFILAEHPNLTASEAIDRSKLLMEGYKMDLFILDLTFIGWDILASMTASLGNIALNPYKNAAHAAFYRQLVTENRERVFQ